MASESEDYEYAYSSQEEDDDDDNNEYPEVDDDDDDGMDWHNTDNPNAAPMAGAGSGAFKVGPAAAAANCKTGIRIMQADELRPEMLARCKDVCEVLGISTSAACVLLQNNNWSKEVLLEKYMQDSDAILQKAGVYHRCGHNVAASQKQKPGMPLAANNCAICFDDAATNDMLAMPCGHSFCLDCWGDFCRNAVAEGPSCVLKTCPQAECDEMVTEDEMAKSLQDSPAVLQKFQTFQLRSFVESNPLTRWCPGAGCERIAYAVSPAVMEDSNKFAHCDHCESHFCIVCGEEPHAPASCKYLQKWMAKCRNESETANWILANTKSCPKCCSRIEKNQGCNHMTCQKCKGEFCWICMGDWKEHGANTGGYYKCNKYDDGTGSGPEDNSDAARAKRDLDRYLHYYQRYHAHSEAQNFAQKQLTETEARMVRLQESSDDARWSDVEFLKVANEQLVECRRVLKFTYVFAFYIGDTATGGGGSGTDSRKLCRDRFEYHQEMLERFTENLSELSEKPLHEMDRTQVVNQTRVVDKFMKNILQYVEDGMDEAAA